MSHPPPTIMRMEQIHPKLVRVALDDVPGSSFEAFAQEFYGGIRGRQYIPLGGTHDKGADGYVDVKEQASGSATEFVLMSVQRMRGPRSGTTLDGSERSAENRRIASAGKSPSAP